MKFFLYTGNLGDVQAVHSYGLLDGVLTSPSVLKEALVLRKKEGKPADLLKQIKFLLKYSGNVPASFDILGNTFEDMREESIRLFRLFRSYSRHLHIRVPVSSYKNSFDGLRVITSLHEDGIPVIALASIPEQALLAAKAGATIVCLPVGWMDDSLRSYHKLSSKSAYYPAEGIVKKDELLMYQGICSGVDLVRKTHDLFVLHNITTEILASDLRNVQQVRECSLAGAHGVAVSYSLLQDMLRTSQEKKKEVISEYHKLLYPK